MTYGQDTLLSFDRTVFQNNLVDCVHLSIKSFGFLFSIQARVLRRQVMTCHTRNSKVTDIFEVYQILKKIPESHRTSLNFQRIQNFTQLEVRGPT